MPIFTEGLPTRNNTFLDEYSAGLGESLGQTARETLIRSPVASLLRMEELRAASDPGGGVEVDSGTGAVSETPKKRMFSQDEALDRAKTAGVKLEFPKDGITEDAFNILVERKQDEMRRQDIMARGPSGFLPGVAKFGTAFGASLLDPINIASAFVPVVGEARYASLLASAGRSTLARTLPRLGVGAAEGLVGAAMVEPIIYGAARYEQADYGMADSALNVAFGGVFGGGLHVLGGSGADAFRAWKGRADPFVRLQGLSVDQIKQVREVERLVDAGIKSPEQLVAMVKTYPPEVLRAAGLISDAMPSDAPVAAPRGTIFGEDTDIRIGDRYVPAQWAVVDLADVEATMTKADNQWRDRTRVASDVQIRKIANDPDFEQLQWSPIMDFGAPTLSKDGRVIGGNGRVMGVSTSYDIGRVGPYRDKLNAALERFGIDAASIEGMSKPMLVRLLREDVDVKKAAILSNEGGSARMSALEQAGVDADRLGDFRGFDIPESGDLNTAANRGAIRQWVGKFPENQQAELVTAEGYLSPQGLLRLRNAILHRAYGDSPVLKSLIEGTDEASTNLTKALTRVAGTIADARGAISRGDLHALDISTDLQVSVAMLKDLRSKGLDFDGYMAQGDLARAPLDPVQLQLLRYLDDNIASPRAIADLVTSFYDQLRREGDPKQGSLLGDAPAPTKEALLDRAMDQVAEDGSAAAKVEKLSAETREAALRVSVAQMAEGRGVEITPIAESDPSIRTMTPESAKAAAERAASVDNVLAADVKAAEAVEERAAALPKSAGLEAAEKAAEDALAVAEDVAARGNDAYKYARAYHGAPTIFAPDSRGDLGGFRWDKINTGEGAQAFGYGHYVAMQEWIAKTRYRDRLVDRLRANATLAIEQDGKSITLTNRDTAYRLTDGRVVAQQGLGTESFGYWYVIDKLKEGTSADELRGWLKEDIARDRTQLAELERGFTVIRRNKEWVVFQPTGEEMQRFKTKAEAVEAQKDYNAGFERVAKQFDSLNTYKTRIAEAEASLRALDELTVDGKLRPDVEEVRPGADLTGSVYTVDIPDELVGRMLVWDAPLGAQPENVRAAFSKFGVEISMGNIVDWVQRDANTWEAGGSGFLIRKVADDLYEVKNKKGVWSQFDSLEAAKQGAVNEIDADLKITGERAYKILADKVANDDVDPDLVMEAGIEAQMRRGMYDPEKFPDGGDFDYAPKADEIASIMLEQAGVPGLRFLDGSARRGGKWNDADASFNYVMFNDDSAKLVARYMRGDAVGPANADNLTEALRLAFGDSTETLLESGRIKIVDDVKGIPDGPHPADVKGATGPDGTVYIVAKNVTADEAKGLLIHEVGEHVGMEQMLGADVYSKVLAQVAEGIARGDDAFVRAAAMVPADTLPQHVAAEQLAYLVQHAPELPLVQRIIAAVRAWVYKTFKLAQDNMELTEADFRALAVSSLHAVAKADRAAMEAAVAGLVPEFRYARAGESGPDVKSEMRQFDEAIKRAELYTAAVRAAAERIGDPNAARSAMDAAAGGNLTATEIDDLLAALRSQNTAVRNRLRKARDAVTAEDDAASMQSDAMKAADELANNILMAAVIEKRNGALNLAARTKALTFVMSEFKGNEAEGVKALLAGSQFKRRGARLSVDAEQKGFEGEWVGGIIADMERENLWRLFTSETMARETARALYLMGDPKADMSGLPKEAVKMAEIIHRYQEDARNTQNRFGAWIRDMKGYIVRQTHDMFRIRAEGFQAWRDYVLPRIDLDKTFYSRGVTDIEAGLREMWANFSAGQHMKFDPDEELSQAFPGMGRSEAKKQSQSRVLYFKDGDGWFDYNERFGAGRFADSVLGGLERASRSAALMKVLGTNPEATMSRLMDEIEDGLRADPEARSRFHEQRKSIDHLFAHVDGRANIPGSHMGAQVSAGLRAWQSMAKLGGAVISSITDIPVYASEQRFQGRGLLSGMADAIGGLMHGRGSKDQQQVLASLGVFFDSMRNGVARRFDAQENVGGRTSKLMQQFFKWNGLTWWTEVLRGSSALSLSHNLAQNTGVAWGKLSPDLRNMLGLYNIDEAKWDLVRMATTREADGRMYLTPEGVAGVPRQALENYITGIGRTVSDASVQNLVDDLSGALRALYIDRAEHAVIEPDARTRALLLRGTNPGTVWGEVARFVAQFKSFPVGMLQKTMGREIYGRGYDTLGQYLKEGKGDMLGLAHLMLWLTVFGYGAMAVKDMLKGRSPRDPLAAGTWTAAFLQGGGAGIYGDFIFGEMRNRFGGGVLNTVAGPVLGTAEDIMDLYGRVKAGDDAAAKAFRVAVNNTPFLNMFYTRMALDYLLLYNIQEQLNPGYLRRMERRIEKENGQTFLIKPSEVVR